MTHDRGQSVPRPADRYGGRLVWLLLAPIVALSAVRELWAPDEPRYAEIARESWERGSFLVLHLCGELYPDKPPLVYWTAALAGALSGWSEFALRVPSLLATAGTAWLCAHLARRFWGEREALWATAFYLGTGFVVWLGGRLALDPALSFFCLASLVLATEPVRGSRNAFRNLALAGLLLGLAALVKGPVAWLHTGFALAAWRFLPRPLAISLARPRLGWVAFALLAIVPVAAWAAAASVAEPALLEPLFFGQHVGRLAEGTAHKGPLWEQLVDQPPLMLPWTFLFAAGLALAFRRWRAARAGDPAAGDLASAGLVRVAAWFGLVFVFFSIIPNKRELYLFPIYPAVALVCARVLAEAERHARLSGWIVWPTLSVAALLAVVLASTRTIVRTLGPAEVPGTGPLEDGLAAAGPWPWIAGLVLFAGAAAALVLWRRGRIGGFTAALLAGFAACETIVALSIVPLANPYSSAREIAELVAGRPEKPSVIPCVGVQPEGYRFYADLPTVKGGLERALEAEGQEFLALLSRKQWAKLDPELRARLEPVELATRGVRDVMLVRAISAER